MVDWVIAAAARARRRSGRRRRLADDARTRSTEPASRSPSRSEPRGTGDAVRSARAALEGRADDVLDPDRRHARAHLGPARRARRDAPARAARRRPCSRSSRRTSALVRPRRARRAPGTSARSSRRPTPRPRSSRSTRSTPRSTSSAPSCSGPRSSGSSRTTPRASSTSPTPFAILVEDGETVAAHVAPDPFEAEGVNTRVELAAAAAVLRDRINERHMLAGVTIVDPATTWIEPDVELEPDVTIQPFVVPARLAPASRTGRDPLAHGRGRRRDRRRRDRRPVLLPSPRDGPRGGSEGRHLRRDQELTHRDANEGAAPLLHRRRRGRRGHERRRRRDHRQLPAPARPAEGPHDDRQERQDRHPQWLRRPGRGRRRSMDLQQDR